jgi:anthranilate synthase
VNGGQLFDGLPAEFTAGRYHSLHATTDEVKGEFEVTAVTSDPAASGSGQIVMAMENKVAGRWAVQFHPESILSADGDAGRKVIANVLRLCRIHQMAPLPTA